MGVHNQREQVVFLYLSVKIPISYDFWAEWDD